MVNVIKIDGKWFNWKMFQSIAKAFHNKEIDKDGVRREWANAQRTQGIAVVGRK
jgi:hypothetical protein